MQKPVHPMLVHFPIALLLTSLLADAAYFFTAFEALRHAGWWMLAAASAGGLLAVMAGIFDMRRASLAEAVHERVHCMCTAAPSPSWHAMATCCPSRLGFRPIRSTSAPASATT